MFSTKKCKWFCDKNSCSGDTLYPLISRIGYDVALYDNPVADSQNPSAMNTRITANMHIWEWSRSYISRLFIHLKMVKAFRKLFTFAIAAAFIYFSRLLTKPVSIPLWEMEESGNGGLRDFLQHPQLQSLLVFDLERFNLSFQNVVPVMKGY